MTTAQYVKQLELPEPPALTDSRPAGRIPTSREAFRQLDESGERRREQTAVLDLITARGEYGATSHEICHVLDLGQQSVSGRCNELMRSGFIYRRGDRRTPAGYTASACIWRASALRFTGDERREAAMVGSAAAPGSAGSIAAPRHHD